MWSFSLLPFLVFGPLLFFSFLAVFQTASRNTSVAIRENRFFWFRGGSRTAKSSFQEACRLTQQGTKFTCHWSILYGMRSRFPSVMIVLEPLTSRVML